MQAAGINTTSIVTNPTFNKEKMISPTFNKEKNKEKMTSPTFNKEKMVNPLYACIESLLCRRNDMQ